MPTSRTRPPAPRPARRVLTMLLVVLATVTAFTGTLPVGPPGLGAAEPAAARGTGQQPLDDILYWADQRKACGLSRDQLAAIMMAPTYPETGASGTRVPGPMTLSRWDTQAALYAFGDKATPYQKAFWHPGVGMWQFDSAGYWDLTAADAINTWSSAREAATVMAQRWCTNPTLRYAWGPWYGCASTSLCEDIYHHIFDGTKLRNLTVDPTVTREGGMEARVCVFAGVVQPCHYVDPAKAQGFAGWAVPAAAPTPVSAPFYVLRHNNREYRFWLKQDTGYAATISADKPVRSNARTSLVWSTAGGLCDQSYGRGDCSGGPRVALTPWGHRYGDPFGNLEGGTGAAASATVSGWAIDPDTNDPVDVHLYLNGVWNQAVRADRSRPDVAAVVPGYGSAHGFSATLPGMAGGTYDVCAYAINRPPTGSTNPLLGCTKVTVTGDPLGNVESATMGPGGVFVHGWALDPDTTGPIGVHVYVNGRWGGMGSTTIARPDVAAAYPWFGTSRGFSILVPLQPGANQVCAYGINTGPGTTNPLLACRTFHLPDGTPLGNLDGLHRVAGGVRAAGWAIDPSTAAPIDVHLYVNGGWGGSYVAGASRPDVGAAYPGFGNAHGFDVVLPVGAASVTVCAYAINTGPGTTNPLLGCRTV